MYKCFLTCARGLEESLSYELDTFVECTMIHNGGVEFKTDKSGLYMISMNSRLGMHLLVELFSFRVDDTEQLYSEVYNFSWHQIINVNQTFMIKVKGKSNYFGNPNYTTLKIKDAIVDQIKKNCFSRPYIDKKNPDIIITIFISDNDVKVYIDSSGDSLHKRGYRGKIHKGALNESLAAGLIMLSSWNSKDNFYDLMCGSGTIPIEAALIAHNIAPGLFRNHFSFQNWHDYEEDLFLEIQNKSKENISINSDIKIYGFDLSFSNIAMSLYSAKLLGIEKLIQFKKQDIKDFSSIDNHGTIIMNPPYGERLDAHNTNLEELYTLIGDILKQQCINFDAYIFTSNLSASKHIGLKSKKRIVLKNGSLDCRLLHYPIRSGEYK